MFAIVVVVPAVVPAEVRPAIKTEPSVIAARLVWAFLVLFYTVGFAVYARL